MSKNRQKYQPVFTPNNFLEGTLDIPKEMLIIFSIWYLFWGVLALPFCRRKGGARGFSPPGKKEFLKGVASGLCSGHGQLWSKGRGLR